MSNLTNIFKDGILVEVHVCFWSGAKALQAEDLGLKETEVADAYKLGKKMLVPTEVIKEFRTIEGRARRVVETGSFRFPIGHARFVPKKRFPSILKKLQGYQDQYTELVGQLIENYDKYRTEMLPVYEQAAEQAFMTQAPSNIDINYDLEVEKAEFVSNFIDRIKSYYPPAETLRNRFSLTWSVYEIAVPRMRKALDESIAEDEARRQLAQNEYQVQIQEKIGDFVSDVIKTLRNETITICDRIRKNITEGKVIKESTVQSLRNFVDRFSSLNFVGDSEVETQLETLQKDVLDSVSTEVINDDEDIREELKKRLGEISDMASQVTDINSVTGQYKRKISWQEDSE